MTIEELKTKGYKTQITFATYVNKGRTPIDPEQKAEMWKLEGGYYWVEEGKIITKMN
jgi:hypothetical protein